MHGIGKGHAAGKVLLHLDPAHFLLARIAADKDDLDALVEHSRLLQEWGASGVPVHLAVPMPLRNHGRP